MSERDIRETISKVCAHLDRRARRVTWQRVAPAVIPFAIGTSAALSACDDETDTTQTGTTSSGTDTGAVPPYGVGGFGGTGATGGTGGTGGEGTAGMGGSGQGGSGGVVSGGGMGGVAGDPGIDYQAPDP